MQIGIFTKTFPRFSLELVLDAVVAAGLRYVQLNMESVGLPSLPDEIPAGLAEHIRDETSARGLSIAAVQGTFNMSHPDPEHRRAGLRRLRVLADVCSTMRTSIIGICIGTRNRENMWRHHKDNDTAEAWRDMRKRGAT
ncbi:MAG: sugar phosphate isomerase/epimerase [Lentisphaerae bacterium]|jgi:sugar phosphate isomerase/epimerase|nr:sugar phosphate isomerase/epimerase [Lentisphaerota bacterium]